MQEGAGKVASDVAKDAVVEAKQWVRWLARFGYAAKGVVYVVVGWLAFSAALGVGGETTDTEGALRSIFRQPAGPFLLTVVGLGLLAYSAWRLAQSLLDVEGKGTGARGLVKRTGYLFSGLAYAGLGWTAITYAIGISTGAGRSQEDWTAIVLAHPFGSWAVFAAGLLLCGLALNAAIVAFGRLFRRKLRERQIRRPLRAPVELLAMVGLLARGTVFGLLGAFFIQAAINFDPSRAGGLSDVLVAIAGAPQGPFLLGLMALGLMAYGLFAMVQARYRKIPRPDSPAAGSG